MFIQYNHVNRRKQVESQKSTSKDLEGVVKSLEHLAKRQVGEARAPESGWFESVEMWKSTMSKKKWSDRYPGLEAEIEKVKEYPDKQQRFDKGVNMQEAKQESKDEWKRVAEDMDPTCEDLITGTGTFRRAFPTL
jgi:hypothetical protein